MEFQSADRTNDASYMVELNDYNKNVELYNKQRTKDILTDKQTAEGLESEAQGGANTNALKEAGQHATAIAQGVKTAKEVNALGTPLKATQDIVEGTQTIKAGDIIGKQTAQTLGRSAGKVASALGVIGDIGTIGLDIAQDKANWGKMSTMDKIGNIADIGGAGLDMVGTGLMTFGGPLGASIGLGLKAFGDLAEVGSGVESTVSGYEQAGQKQTEIKKQEQQAEKDEGPAEVEAGPIVSEAGAGTLAVARQAQV